MEREKAQAVIEAVLFTMGESVEVSKLADAIGEDVKTTKAIITDMMGQFGDEKRGVTIIELEDAYQMCTKGDMYEYLLKVAKAPRKFVLTDALLETLSIIAYKQPITRLEVERVRGVNSDHAVNRLVEFGLVEEVGRLDAPGRPLLFGTTEEFLRSFGVRSLDELPELGPEQIDDFRHQAEEEVDMKVDI
ncbi:MAG: SMC-Scp complex subunit ScpB [Lachnospiraceae bacterium]|nr:SMC-Scp complex subunit ScpB [Lachnospiraceae bacterium]